METKPIKIEINSAAVLAAFNRLAALGHNPRPAFDAIGMALENNARKRFEAKTDPSGKAWAKWKPSTIKSYPKDGNKKLLDRYGDMLASISYQIVDGGVAVGSGQPYAAYHEFGTTKMDRRGIFTAAPDAGLISAEDEAAILDILNAHLARAIGGG